MKLRSVTILIEDRGAPILFRRDGKDSSFTAAEPESEEKAQSYRELHRSLEKFVDDIELTFEQRGVKFSYRDPYLWVALGVGMLLSGIIAIGLDVFCRRFF